MISAYIGLDKNTLSCMKYIKIYFRVTLHMLLLHETMRLIEPKRYLDLGSFKVR